MTAVAATSPLVIADIWWDGGWGIVWGLATAAFWIAAIAVIVVLVRAAARGPDGVGGGSALDVLEER